MVFPSLGRWQWERCNIILISLFPLIAVRMGTKVTARMRKPFPRDSTSLTNALPCFGPELMQRVPGDKAFLRHKVTIPSPQAELSWLWCMNP
jgi:hypothetical protein